jgi:hypothetical protein
MDWLHIDTIGPFPIDKEGNQHIINIICSFSRFIEICAVKTTDAASASKVLLQHFGRYGVPSRLTSDRGTQFVNDVLKELATLTDVKHILTEPYSKEQNGIVERSNKEINRHLRAICFHKNIINEWSSVLPMVQRIINASVHKSIGVSPAQIIFGNSIQLDRNVYNTAFPHVHNADKESDSFGRWAADMLKKQSDIIRIAYETQLKTDEFHMSQVKFDPEEETIYPINSYVLVQYPMTAMGNKPPTKLHTNLKGPMRVINFVGSIYTLQDLISNKEETVHIKRIKPFYYDPRCTDPVDIARRDYQSTVVEKILDHAGDINKVSQLDFLVKWQDVPDSGNLWLPWSELRNNPALHSYLREKNLIKLIPKEHRSNKNNN